MNISTNTTTTPSAPTNNTHHFFLDQHCLDANTTNSNELSKLIECHVLSFLQSLTSLTGENRCHNHTFHVPRTGGPLVSSSKASTNIHTTDTKALDTNRKTVSRGFVQHGFHSVRLLKYQKFYLSNKKSSKDNKGLKSTDEEQEQEQEQTTKKMKREQAQVQSQQHQAITVKSLENRTTSQSYTQMWRLLGHMYTLLGENKTVTQRELYYMTIDSWTNQEQCNRRIMDTCLMLNCPRSSVGIVTSSKGYLYGHITLQFTSYTTATSSVTMGSSTAISGGLMTLWERSFNGGSNNSQIIVDSGTGGMVNQSQQRVKRVSVIDVRSMTSCPGMNIPGSLTTFSIDDISIVQQAAPLSSSSLQQRVRFVLIVEKDGVYRRLIEDGFCQKMSCVIVTACGYPDVATRYMIHVLCRKLQVPAYCLTDFNPHGFHIFLTYAIGSTTEHNMASHTYTINDLKWLGVHYEDIEEYNLVTTPLVSPTSMMVVGTNNFSSSSDSSKFFSSSDSNSSAPSGANNLSSSSNSNMVLLNKLLQYDYVNKYRQGVYRAQLDRMIQGNKCCEIQSFNNFGYSALTRIVAQKILRHKYL